jgi:hypothetical protein
MVRTARTRSRRPNEEISVSAFRHIQIHFPGDVYFLALWIAMSDRAKSTPTCRQHTTLHGLANKFASLYGVDYANPRSSEDVMAVFRGHGITGNPLLRLDSEVDPSSAISQIEKGSMLSAQLRATAPQIPEQAHPTAPAAAPISNGESSPLAR